MAKYVVFVHGAIEEKHGFHRLLFKDFRRRLESLLPSGQFYWEEANWSEWVQDDENYLKDLTNRKCLRKFMSDLWIGYVGDLVAYSGGRRSDFQECFTNAIWTASKTAERLNDTDAQLSVIGHSLGSIIAYDGLSDIMSRGKMPPNLTLNGLFTLGSPIAVWNLQEGLGIFPKLINPQTKVWLNFYYPQDIFSCPLEKLAGNASFVEDIRLSPISCIRRLTTFWPVLGWWGPLPLAPLALLLMVGPQAHYVSHGWYFSDKTVLETIRDNL